MKYDVEIDLAGGYDAPSFAEMAESMTDDELARSEADNQLEIERDLDAMYAMERGGREVWIYANAPADPDNPF